MIEWISYAMVYSGSLLMAYNIYGFVRFARYVQGRKSWGDRSAILYVPIALLVLFLLGYLAVAFAGRPDILVAGILFGGSVFVFVIYKLLTSITQQVIESEHRAAALLATEESNRVKSSFLASVSHEMRTPMNVIIGLNGMALKHPDLPYQVRDQLEKQRHSARHLLDLINNALDLQRIETGVLVLKDEAFSLEEQLSQIDTIVRPQAREKGLDYEMHVGPGAAGDYEGDATQLKRALLCVLDNAVKFSYPCGMVRFSVDCAARDGDKRTLQFRITDTGVGIDADYLPKIFEPFSQEDASATSRFGGSGVGLTIAKSVVDRMGGSIDVASEKDEGSTFTITVPLKLAPRAAAEPEPPQGVDSLEDRVILVVDDLDENAEIVSDLLELEGALTERAENGQRAVEMVAQSDENHFDAVLMDLRMPIMDGWEAARRIRELDREDARRMPIIALTANAFESDIQHSLDAGMNEHLVKPVDADKLYATLKHYIRPT